MSLSMSRNRLPRLRGRTRHHQVPCRRPGRHRLPGRDHRRGRHRHRLRPGSRRRRPVPLRHRHQHHGRLILYGSCVVEMNLASLRGSGCVLRLSKRVVGPAPCRRRQDACGLGGLMAGPGAPMRRCDAKCLAQQASHCLGQRIATAAWFASREDLKSCGCGGSGRSRRREVTRRPRTVPVRPHARSPATRVDCTEGGLPSEAANTAAGSIRCGATELRGAPRGGRLRERTFDLRSPPVTLTWSDRTAATDPRLPSVNVLEQRAAELLGLRGDL